MNAQWFDQYGNVACRSKTYKCNAFLREREREREREILNANRNMI